MDRIQLHSIMIQHKLSLLDLNVGGTGGKAWFIATLHGVALNNTSAERPGKRTISIWFGHI